MPSPDLSADRRIVGAALPAEDQRKRRPERETPKGKEELDKELDDALEDSFPASDPPTPSQPTGTEPAGDPKTKP